MVILICLIFFTLSCASASDEGISSIADLNNLDVENFNSLEDTCLKNVDVKNSNNLGNGDYINLSDEKPDSIDNDVYPDDSFNYSGNETYQTYIANFTELNDLIDRSDSILSLEKDYGAINDTDNLTIAKSIIIYGNNHTLDCKNSSIIIGANDSEIAFENITFKDSYFMAYDLHNVNISFNNCTFDFFIDMEDIVVVVQEPWVKTVSGPIANKIKKLAFSIIGKSENLTACKKLAVWVGKNIIHESHDGFYQSPLTTLNRRRGNCCTQTNLFFQMCEAVGLTKKYQFCFVHVGQAYFGGRHFFAMIDNLLVDVDSKPDDPWGQASILNRGVYRVTQYPVLPVTRKY